MGRPLPGRFPRLRDTLFVDEAALQAIADYAKPLAVGLDGVTYWGNIERIVVAAHRIAASEPQADHELVYLLAVFSGQDRWVSRMGHRSRTEIFLSSLHVPFRTVQALFRGLPRLETHPQTREEHIVRDALRLETLGAFGIARLLQEGYRERMDFAEIADAIDRAAAVAMMTAAGEALAAPRRNAMRDFARQLRDEVAEFG